MTAELPGTGRSAPWRIIRTAGLVGAGLGTVGRLLDHAPGQGLWVGNLAAVWLAAAFVAGLVARTRQSGVAAGAGALTVASLIHYIPIRAARAGLGWHVFDFPLGWWVAAGLLAGGILGWLGGAFAGSDTRLRWISAGILAATFAGEGLVLWALEVEPALRFAVPLELIVATAIVAYAAKSIDRFRVATIAAILTLPIVIGVLLEVLQRFPRVYPGV